MTSQHLPAGIETEELDSSIRPQDDLFGHVNAKWIARTPIPADKPRYGTFYQLAEAAEKAVREIIEEAQGAADGTEERKVGDLYSSFMDEQAIEAKGAEPLAPHLAAIDAITSIDQLMPALGRLERQGLASIYGAFVDNDPGDPTRYLVQLYQSGLGLPDEAYYREEQHAETRSTYTAHVERMLSLAGLDDAATRAERILELETDLAARHWDRVASRDAEKTYNLRTWAEVTASAPGLDLDGWLAAVGAPEGAFAEVVLYQPSFTEKLPELVTAERLAAWLDWTRWHVVHSLAPYLSSDFVQTNFEFYGQALQGTEQLRARWKRGVGFVEGAMGEAVGRVYVERHFPPTAKQGMDALVARLIDAYGASIRELEWMTPATRERALQKLAKFTPKIGYPARWRDYSALEVSADDVIANVAATNDFEFRRELGKIGRQIDREEWFMTPQTVNAYYNPGFNEIVFPAAILQHPFYVENRDDAANYGAIGAVIGHEIGHGFDDQGSKFDGDGKLEDWWTDADRQAFEQRTAALIAQYDALEVLPGLHVNGALTIGENIGDLGGLGIAWKAYLASLEGADPQELGGLTAGQRFLFGWAESWREMRREAETRRLAAIDPHSPPVFRCNQIVRNLDVFYDTFGVTPDDELWLDPVDRVTIW